jgi:hypothetical protein
MRRMTLRFSALRFRASFCHLGGCQKDEPAPNKNLTNKTYIVFFLSLPFTFVRVLPWILWLKTLLKTSSSLCLQT